MWPQLLDMTKEESIQSLRSLELEAYASLVTALRAQGPLNQSKLKILKETSSLLNITQERHKAEIRRAVNDEKLNTIAYHVCGHNTYLEEWAQEGRWLVPLMQRSTPQTAFSIIADEAAETASASNKQLPFPALTERKRNQNQHLQGAGIADNNKSLGYRMPDAQKMEDCRKRKLGFCPENSGMSQYPMGPPKISKIQQIYRQRTKAKVKEQQQQLPLKIKQEPDQKDHLQKKVFTTTQAMLIPQSTIKLPLSPQSSSPKINVLQNITVPPLKTEVKEEMPDSVISEQNEEIEALSPQPSCSNENQAPKLQKPVIATIKTSQGLVLKPGDVHKSIKICPRKALAKTVSPGQKLIVVSTAQPVTSSVLHRALTVPIVKNLDKFKIVSSTTGATTTLPIAAVKSVGANSIRHKVVTVRTNTLPKKVSLSHLQLLNAKGSIKVLPFGGKIITKNTTLPTSNLIIVNSTESNNTTKSITSTPVIMTTKPQESGVVAIKATESENVEQLKDEEQKSSVLADILKASGVTASDSETCEEESESQQTVEIEQPYGAQDDVEQAPIVEINEEACVVEEKIVEENGDISVENMLCDETSAEHIEESFHEVDATYMILDQESNSNDLLVQDENSAQNMEIEETKVSDTDESVFQQCVINEGVVMCGDNAVCTNLPSDSVIFGDD